MFGAFQNLTLALDWKLIIPLIKFMFFSMNQLESGISPGVRFRKGGSTKSEPNPELWVDVPSDRKLWVLGSRAAHLGQFSQLEVGSLWAKFVHHCNKKPTLLGPQYYDSIVSLRYKKKKNSYKECAWEMQNLHRPNIVFFNVCHPKNIIIINNI